MLLKGHGGTDQLEYRDDVAVPTPAAGEVLIRISAAALNNTDINMRVGWYSKSVNSAIGAADSGWAGDALGFPRIQGADACGYIAAVGAGVDDGRVGERVLIDPVLRPACGRPLYFGSDTQGAFAEFAVVPAQNACAVRSTLADVELASFPCAYLAAENMLTRARVTPGERLLVTGASGGVGSAAVQLASRRNTTVIALAERTKAAAIHELGATRVLPRDSDLLAALGRESLDVVIDVVGGAGFARLLETLARTGRYAVAGAIGGPLVSLDLRTLYLKDLCLLGCTIPAPEVFASLIGYIERGELRPVIAATYPLREIVAAQTEFMRKSHVGKIVLTI
ncbi:MAG TPA: alcohol dehydrogenase family protein [Steroidobacteraceae bacterium]|nr:alcohol dehydrogenase family protein [Steroidobacteraceae bacterium]